MDRLVVPFDSVSARRRSRHGRSSSALWLQEWPELPCGLRRADRDCVPIEDFIGRGNRRHRDLECEYKGKSSDETGECHDPLLILDARDEMCSTIGMSASLSVDEPDWLGQDHLKTEAALPVQELNQSGTGN